MDKQDHYNAQDLIDFAEWRFRKIVLAMDRNPKGIDKRPRWMDVCLRQELVSFGVIPKISIH